MIHVYDSDPNNLLFVRDAIIWAIAVAWDRDELRSGIEHLVHERIADSIAAGGLARPEKVTVSAWPDSDGGTHISVFLDSWRPALMARISASLPDWQKRQAAGRVKLVTP